MATVFGLQPNFPCCTVNLPQGWPKFAMSAILSNVSRSQEKKALFYPIRVLVAHLIPVMANISNAGQLTISTQYPFEDQVVLLASAATTGPGLVIDIRVPGWAVGASVIVGSNSPVSLKNGTIFSTLVKSGRNVKFVVRLNPVLRIERGWGRHKRSGPTSIQFAKPGIVKLPTSNPVADWSFSAGAAAVGSVGRVGDDIRSGNPGQTTRAWVSHPLDSQGHFISQVSVDFRYVAGYDLTKEASTLSIVVLDAFDGTPIGPPLWTSKPLNESQFSPFKGFSPSVHGCSKKELALFHQRQVVIGLEFCNNGRNLQIEMNSLNITVTWGNKSSLPYSPIPNPLSKPACNAVAVRRGPLLYALELNESRAIVRNPAAGGFCEDGHTGSNCHAVDLAFTAQLKTWNLALRDLSEASFHSTNQSNSLRRPFDGPATNPPPIWVEIGASLLPEWKMSDGGGIFGKGTRGSLNPPPPSPVSSNSTGPSNIQRLIPFGMTNIRIAAFPWVDDESN